MTNTFNPDIIIAFARRLLAVVRAADKTRDCRWEHLDTQPPFDDLWYALDDLERDYPGVLEDKRQ